MTDRNLIDEIALNAREISHPDWGTFIISRPTNRVLADMSTARTRSLNRDLQEREKVYDPSTGNYKLVPAFLTKQGKRKILEEFGDWTEEDQRRIEELEEQYRQACVALEREGFEGVAELNQAYSEASEALKAALEEKPEEFSEELTILFPMENEDDETKNEVDAQEYAKARESVAKKAKDIEVVNILAVVDKLHKQYDLLMKGMIAQSDLTVKKVDEIRLFADTAESRADNRAQLVKLQRCTKNEDGSLVWATVEECENEVPDKLGWIIQEIERFERVDPKDPTNSQNRASKYNFLEPLLGTSDVYEESPEEETSKPDGELAEEKV